jgi:hypothetical protein
LALINKYYSGNQIKKSEIGRSCGTYGGKKMSIQCYGGETCGKNTIWKTKTKEEGQYSKGSSKIGWENFDSFNLAQERNNGRLLLTRLRTFGTIKR